MEKSEPFWDHIPVGLDMRPFLGKNVHLDQGDWQVVVKDLYGDERLGNGAGSGTFWWRSGEARSGTGHEAALPSPTLVVLNQNCSSARSAGLDKGEDTVFCRAPYFPDPFFPDRLGQEFYGRVCGVCGIEERSGGRWAEKRRKLRHAVKSMSLSINLASVI